MPQSESDMKDSIPKHRDTLNSNIDFDECAKMADRAMEAEICISQKLSNEVVAEINIDLDCPKSSDSFPTEAANEACRRCISSGQRESDLCGNCLEDLDCETQPVKTNTETNVHQTLRSLKESVGELNRVICCQFNSSSTEEKLMAEIRCMRTQLCELIHIVQEQTNTEGASPCSKDTTGELSKNIEDIKCQLQQLIVCVCNLANKCGSDDNRRSIVSKVQTLKNCIEDAIATERGMCDDNAEATSPMSCTEKTRPRCSSPSLRQSQSCPQPKANCSIHKKPSLSMAKLSNRFSAMRASSKPSCASQQRFTLNTTNPRASSAVSKPSARKSTQSAVPCQQPKTSASSISRPTSVMSQGGASCTQTRASSTTRPSETQSIRETAPRGSQSEVRGSDTCAPRPIELLCDTVPRCSAVVMVDEPRVSCPTVEEPRVSGSYYSQTPRPSEITIPANSGGNLSRTQSSLQPEMQPRSMVMSMNPQEPRLSATPSYYQQEEDVCSGAALMTPESLCEKVESIISSSMGEDPCDTEPRRPTSGSVVRASSYLQPRASCESEPRMTQNACLESMERILMILQNLEGVATEIGCQDRALDLIASMRDLLVSEFGQVGSSEEPECPYRVESRPSVEEVSYVRNSVASSDLEQAPTLNTQIKQVLCNLHAELQTYLGETKDEILDMLDEITLLLEELENCDKTENIQADDMSENQCAEMPRQSMSHHSQVRQSSKGKSSYDGRILEIVDDIEDLIRQTVATCSSNKDNPDCHLASADDLAFAEGLMRERSSERDGEEGENPRLTMNAKVAEVLCELRGIVLAMELEGSNLSDSTMCKMEGIFDQIERILQNDKQNAELLVEIRRSLNRLEEKCNPQCGSDSKEGNEPDAQRNSTDSGKRKSSSSRKSLLGFRRSKNEKDSQNK